MKRQHPERELTKAVAVYLTYALKPTVMWTHLPMGEKRNIKTGALLKAMGTKPGWPDDLLYHQGQLYFIELKHGKGQLTNIQKTVHADLILAGAKIAVCRSIDEVKAQCKDWGLLK